MIFNTNQSSALDFIIGKNIIKAKSLNFSVLGWDGLSQTPKLKERREIDTPKKTQWGKKMTLPDLCSLLWKFLFLSIPSSPLHLQMGRVPSFSLDLTVEAMAVSRLSYKRFCDTLYPSSSFCSVLGKIQQGVYFSVLFCTCIMLPLKKNIKIIYTQWNIVPFVL